MPLFLNKEVKMTGNELLNTALDLLGLRNESGTLPMDVNDLKQRALSLINILLAENSSLDARINRCEHTVKSINTLDDNIDMSDIVVNDVLPYGLACLFMLGEDDSLAKDMNTLYSRAKDNALKFGKAKVEPITEVYS